MGTITSTFSRDGNRVPIWTNGMLLKKTITFDSGTGTGATGATTLLTVTGSVALNVFAICTTDLAGASATIEMGTVTSTAALADQQTATDIDNHEVWHDAVLAVGGAVAGHQHVVNEDVTFTVGTAAISGGVLEFYCWWVPLSDDGNVTVA